MILKYHIKIRRKLTKSSRPIEEIASEMMLYGTLTYLVVNKQQIRGTCFSS